MHRNAQLTQRAAIGFRQRLKPKTDTEDRQLTLSRLVDGRLAVEVLRRTRSGRQHDKIRIDAVEHFFGNRRTHSRNRCTRLPEIIGECVYEGIFVIDQQDRNPLTHLCGNAFFSNLIALLCFTHRGNHCGCLQFGFCFFLFGIGIKQ